MSKAGSRRGSRDSFYRSDGYGPLRHVIKREASVISDLPDTFNNPGSSSSDSARVTTDTGVATVKRRRARTSSAELTVPQTEITSTLIESTTAEQIDTEQRPISETDERPLKIRMLDYIAGHKEEIEHIRSRIETLLYQAGYRDYIGGSGRRVIYPEDIDLLRRQIFRYVDELLGRVTNRSQNQETRDNQGLIPHLEQAVETYRDESDLPGIMNRTKTLETRIRILNSEVDKLAKTINTRRAETKARKEAAIETEKEKISRDLSTRLSNLSNKTYALNREAEDLLEAMVFKRGNEIKSDPVTDQVSTTLNTIEAFYEKVAQHKKDVATIVKNINDRDSYFKHPAFANDSNLTAALNNDNYSHIPEAKKVVIRALAIKESSAVIESVARLKTNLAKIEEAGILLNFSPLYTRGESWEENRNDSFRIKINDAWLKFVEVANQDLVVNALQQYLLNVYHLPLRPEVEKLINTINDVGALFQALLEKIATTEKLDKEADLLAEKLDNQAEIFQPLITHPDNTAISGYTEQDNNKPIDRLHPDYDPMTADRKNTNQKEIGHGIEDWERKKELDRTRANEIREEIGLAKADYNDLRIPFTEQDADKISATYSTPEPQAPQSGTSQRREGMRKWAVRVWNKAAGIVGRKRGQAKRRGR